MVYHNIERPLLLLYLFCNIHMKCLKSYLNDLYIFYDLVVLFTSSKVQKNYKIKNISYDILSNFFTLVTKIYNTYQYTIIKVL